LLFIAVIFPNRKSVNPEREYAGFNCVNEINESPTAKNVLSDTASRASDFNGLIFFNKSINLSESQPETIAPVSTNHGFKCPLKMKPNTIPGRTECDKASLINAFFWRKVNVPVNEETILINRTARNSFMRKISIYS
jgi:hypothetical protein